MLIAVDFDGVISEDEAMWGWLMSEMKERGHDVCIVTQNFRGDRDDIRDFSEDVDVPVFFAGSHKKHEYMTTMVGCVPDIIIDDNPASWVSETWA